MTGEVHFYEKVTNIAQYDNLTIQLILSISFPQEESRKQDFYNNAYIEKYNSQFVDFRKLYKLF